MLHALAAGMPLSIWFAGRGVSAVIMASAFLFDLIARVMSFGRLGLWAYRLRARCGHGACATRCGGWCRAVKRLGKPSAGCILCQAAGGWQLLF